MVKFLVSKNKPEKRLKGGKNQEKNDKDKIEPQIKSFRTIRKFRKSLYIRSPFYFNDSSHFYYMVKKLKFFSNFVKDLNKYKPSNEEKNLLLLIIQKYKEEINNNNHKANFVEIKKYFYDSFINLSEVIPAYNQVNERILNIVNEIQKESSVSINKIIRLYHIKYGIILSKTTVHRKLRNKLKYRYKKTCLKPKNLENNNYKKMSFIFIKIVLRALYLNYNIIYIDESNFQLENKNFRTWIKKEDHAHYGYKGFGKINFLLAICTNDIINYKFTEENTNSKVFSEFFEETIKKIDKKEINKI